MNRAFVNILTKDVSKTATFYENLLGMTRVGDFGWFVVLSHKDVPKYEFGILDRNHATVPTAVSADPAGFIATFVVEDVGDTHAQAIAMGAEVIQEPTDLPYGQRRLLLRDPAGAVVDVSSPIR